MPSYCLANLSEDIFYFYVRECLSPTDYRELLNTNQQLFQYLKQNSFPWELSITATSRFLQDTSFRNKVLTTLSASPASPSKKSSNYYFKPHYSTKLLGLHIIQRVKPSLNKSKTQVKVKAKADDQDPQSNDDHDQNEQELDALQVFFDSYLGNHSDVEVCPLRSCIFEGFHDHLLLWQSLFFHPNFYQLHTLKLIDCKELTSLSFHFNGLNDEFVRFDRLFHIEIVKCPKLKDVSSLGYGNNTSIKLIDCDVSVFDHFGDSFYRNGVEVPSKLQELVVSSSANSIDLASYHNLRRLSKVSFPRCEGLYFLDVFKGSKQLKELDLSGTSIASVESIAHIQSLDLTDCKNIKLSEFYLLGCQTYLSLAKTEIIDVSRLGNVKKLDLSHCLEVVDVSALGHVRELNLSHCSKITDFSRLGQAGQLILDLSHTNITHTNNLADVCQLNLSNCKNLVDISSLGTSKGRRSSLNLHYCLRVKSVSHLGLDLLFRLDLSGIADAVKDVSMFSHIYDLNLSKCHQITDFSQLGRRGQSILTLSFTKIASIADFLHHPDCEITQLTCEHCYLLSELSRPKEKTVSAVAAKGALIEGAEAVAAAELRAAHDSDAPISVLEQTENSIVTISEDQKLPKDTEATQSRTKTIKIKELKLSNCPRISDISPLVGCLDPMRAKVDLSGCIAIDAIAALQHMHVYDLKLSYCWKIFDFSVFQSMYEGDLPFRLDLQYSNYAEDVYHLKEKIPHFLM
jgi:hypothetical protein